MSKSKSNSVAESANASFSSAKPGASAPCPLSGQRIPHRQPPRIEDGNQKEGWQHIDERHVSGTADKGPGDLFPPGTTRKELEKVASKIVQKGTRISDPSRRIQSFERVVKVGGRRDRVRVVVDSDDGNRVVTMHPVRSE